jgi:hypothetical protein
VGKIPNMRPLDAGELAMATPIESFTAVLLQLNLHYKTRVAVKLTGIPEAKIAAERAASAAAARTAVSGGSGGSGSGPAKNDGKPEANADKRQPKDAAPA